jgi:oligoribonuclease (3'-5' exoribonuclease)
LRRERNATLWSKPSRCSSDKLVWIDCEMTGLELSRDALIEIAVLVTDADLTSSTVVWTS